MRAAAVLLLTAFACGPAAAEYPRIARLDSRDPTFRQLEQDVESYQLAAARGDRRLQPPLTLFSYDRSREDLFSLAARLSLPYDTVATANSLTNPEDLDELYALADVILVLSSGKLLEPAGQPPMRSEIGALMAV